MLQGTVVETQQINDFLGNPVEFRRTEREFGPGTSNGIISECSGVSACDDNPGVPGMPRIDHHWCFESS